jgi:hypothetical protein
MRGYRQVSFKQFSEHCKFKKVFAAFPAAELCEDLSIYSGCSCCPSFCARWRNVNRANAKVVKITVRAKRPVQQLKAKIAAMQKVLDSDEAKGEYKISIVVVNNWLRQLSAV